MCKLVLTHETTNTSNKKFERNDPHSEFVSVLLYFYLFYLNYFCIFAWVLYLSLNLGIQQIVNYVIGLYK